MHQILEWMGGYIWLTAFVLGALHALQPGHGKTIVAAYLVGAHGTVKDAVFLGIVVTITHTLVIYLLAGIAQGSSAFLPMEEVEGYLGIFASLMILIVGLGLLYSQWRRHHASHQTHHHASHNHSHEHHAHHDGSAHEGNHRHEHPHGHSHSHDDGHSHLPGFGHSHPDPSQMTSLTSIFLLGVSGGIVPCPEGLAVFLASLASGQIETGLLLVMVFSLGLAATLVAVGILFLKASHLFGKSEHAGKWGERIAWVSAALISIVGAVYLGKYLVQLYA